MSKLILFQGDSITDGNRIKTNEWDLNHQMGHGYAFIINASLGAQYPERDYRFLNRGISGNRISDLFSKWQEHTLVYKPDILSILIGVNDVHFYLENGCGSIGERFEKIYQLLIDEVMDKNADTKIVMCEPFVLPVKDKEERCAQMLDLLCPMQETVRILAERNNAVFVPLQKRFEEAGRKTGNEYWIWDGVHPTVCSHQLIADAWMENCKEIL